MSSTRLTALLIACLIGGSSGCGWAKRKPYGNDPLVRQHKPVIGVLPGQPRAIATRAEPYPPPRPVLPNDPAFVRKDAPTVRAPVIPEIDPPAPDALTASNENPAPKLGAPPRSESAAPAQPASVTSEYEVLPQPRTLPNAPSEESKSVPEAVRPDAKDFAFAADYRWLQGTLDVHHRGALALRYCDASVEDRWGGKVRLEDDERLKPFSDGDVLRIEGAIVATQNGSGSLSAYPLYRITAVTIVRRGNEVTRRE